MVRQIGGWTVDDDGIDRAHRRTIAAAVAQRFPFVARQRGEACEVQNERGPIKKGLAADIIAVLENPLEDIDALRDVEFVMKDGQVFKRDGIVMPMNFFHSGPKYGWRVR